VASRIDGGVGRVLSRGSDSSSRIIVSHAPQIHHTAIVTDGAAERENTQPNLAHEKQNTNARMPDAKQQ
jgi:hypothetical protein